MVDCDLAIATEAGPWASAEEEMRSDQGARSRIDTFWVMEKGSKLMKHRPSVEHPSVDLPKFKPPNWLFC